MFPTIQGVKPLETGSLRDGSWMSEPQPIVISSELCFGKLDPLCVAYDLSHSDMIAVLIENFARQTGVDQTLFGPKPYEIKAGADHC
nr:hypothetical protein [uncultured Shimia sp.]